MVERLLTVEQHRRADRDRHPRQHAQGRLGRDEPLHDRPAARRECADPRRAVHRPRPAPALRQAHRRPAVDRLTIVAHDRFQEIVDEANRPDSPIRLQAVVIDPDELAQNTVTVVSQPTSQRSSASSRRRLTSSTTGGRHTSRPPSPTPEEQKVAQIAYAVIRKLETSRRHVPSFTYLDTPGGAGGQSLKRSRGAVPAGAAHARRRRPKSPTWPPSSRRRPNWSSSRPFTSRVSSSCRWARCKSGFKPFALDSTAQLPPRL